jgi:predicted nuclease of predicted toxin-antitoxin system
MRGKVDENMPIESAGVLRTAGWECDTVFDEALSGAKDPDVGARCQAEGRVLFTLDTDSPIFGRILRARTSASWSSAL